MTEINKLQTWMKTNGYTVAQLANELQLAYITAYMNIVKRQSLSDDFKLRFQERFGEPVASQIFDTKLEKESACGITTNG